MRRVWATLGWMKANLTWSIPAAMLLGLVLGSLGYVIQIQTSAWHNKFVDRCFGTLETLETPALAGDQA